MGTQAALFLRTHLLGSWVYDVKVNGDTVDKLNVTNTDSISQYLTIIDTSGCRHSGVMYKPGTVVNSNTGTCLNCSDTAVLQTSDCMMDTTTTTSTTTSTTTTSTTSTPSTTTTTCTVTGPTVIDFHGQVNSIQDRCAYSLLSDPSVPNFQVLANFQERRRKDVSFLDSVTLTVDGSGVLIHLEQGGVVKLDDSVLTLNSSAQLVHGVELSKNQSGVTANISLPNYTTLVFFDGYTAQITLKGPGEPSLVSGLCGNSSRSLSELRISNYSVSGCEVLYNDTADSTIDCTMETERSVIQNIKSGPWDYTLTMKSYTDAARRKAVDSSTEVLLDQRIWVEIKTDGLDGRVIAVVTDSCWATNEPSPNSTLRYNLIKNSCPNPADQTVRVQGNGLGTSNYFSFNMFQFSGHSGDVYLHCKVQLCVKQNNNCVPDCVIPLRSRRSARPPKYEHEAAALITMIWTN
ncbi:uncharacterized protein LOC113168243 [Anabas testudineus]|uniref:ZP domain-containing protein n=2 Tax=Anabas testudineus TaxID=64144 RepID=A0A7N6FCR5_ANATE|nr:uncharacterized protein LOC113168243 [Anabas testudineus]